MGNQQAVRVFTEKDVQILIKTSGKTDAEIRQWYEDFQRETENVNRMNKRQFRTYYSKLKKKNNLDEITDHIFRAFDTDHSGTIDFQEFLLAYIASSDGPADQKFQYAFEVYDINDDQLIDKKEAKKIFNLICRIIGLSDEEAKSYAETMMIHFDTNHDKVLTQTEFINGCVQDPTLAKMSNPFILWSEPIVGLFPRPVRVLLQ